MNLKQRTFAFVETGLFINRHFDKNQWIEKEKNLHEGLNHLIDTAFVYNGWFIRPFIEESLKNIALILNENSLNSFVKNIPEPKQTKTIALIMAGNIPMVGFHDLMSVLLCGHKALVKLSSDDNVLIPFFVKLLDYYAPGFAEKVSYSENRLSNFDAVIATGSNNTSNYFEYYFGKYPHIIRKNRRSAAVLSGKESTKDLNNLGKDIFTFFGLGCRNVSTLLVPEGYKFDSFFEAVYDYKFVIDNKKYSNNYEYNRAIYLMNKDAFLDNNFLLVKPDNNLQSPVAVINYTEYKSDQEAQNYLMDYASQLQCVIGKAEGQVPFGYSQQPVITDFADGVNTLNFLVTL